MKKGNIHSVGFISLGCPKALVDTEQIVNLLVSEDIRNFLPFKGGLGCGQYMWFY